MDDQVFQVIFFQEAADDEIVQQHFRHRGKEGESSFDKGTYIGFSIYFSQRILMSSSGNTWSQSLSNQILFELSVMYLAPGYKDLIFSDKDVYNWCSSKMFLRPGFTFL